MTPAMDILPGPTKHTQQMEQASKVTEYKDTVKVVQPTSSKPEGNGPPFPFAGILANALASFFFSLSFLCIKLYPDETDGLANSTKLLFFRGLVIALLCRITILVQKSNLAIPRDELLVNFLRSFFGFASMYTAYISFRYISMGDSTALVFSSPVWTSLLSHYILEEPLHWIMLFALPVSILAIVLIAHPALIIPLDYLPEAAFNNNNNNNNVEGNQTTSSSSSSSSWSSISNYSMMTSANMSQQHSEAGEAATLMVEPYDLEHRWPGIVVALISSLMISLVFITLKFRKKTPIQTTTFYLGLYTVIVSGAIMVCFTGFGQVPSSAYDYMLLLANGICSWLGQAFLQWSFMNEAASILSVVGTLEVAFSFLLSALFLDDQILWTSVVGAVIIGLVVISIVLNNWLTSVLRHRNLAR